MSTKTKTKKAGRQPSDVELGAIAEASLANAVALIAEARMLHNAGAYPRSNSVAILAAEEFAKCQMAVGAVGGATTDPDYWKAWWKCFYGHGPKLARAAGFARPFLLEDLVESFINFLQKALKDHRREVGFYVDVVRGRLVTPSEAISCEEAADAIQCFGAVIDGYASKFSEVGLAAAFEEGTGGSPASEMRAALASRDADRIRETWEATTGFRPGDEQMEEIMAILDGAQ